MTTETRSIQQINKGRSRVYRVEGLGDLPSVTTILNVIAKPALIPWANKEGRRAVAEYLTPHVGQILTSDLLFEALEKARTKPDETKGAAADVGARAHAAIEAIIGSVPNADALVTDDIRPAVDNWRAWRDQSGIAVSLSERMVYSERFLYAGSVDAVGMRGDTLVALDWKTSNGLYDEAALQVAAYANAWGEMTGNLVDEAWVVRVGKDKPEFEARKVRDLNHSFEAFRAALTLYRMTHGFQQYSDGKE